MFWINITKTKQDNYLEGSLISNKKSVIKCENGQYLQRYFAITCKQAKGYNESLLLLEAKQLSSLPTH